MGDGDEVVEALQKEAELLKAKLLIERSKVTDKSCKLMIVDVVPFFSLGVVN